MRIKILCASFALFIIFFPNLCNSRVYFSGWIASPENVLAMNMDNTNISPMQIPNYYQQLTFKTIQKKAHPQERMIVVDPRRHTWKAYSASGKVLRSGMATAGSRWCSDIGRPCRTKSGTFRIHSLGSASCKSSKYPVGRGGAPMPYCMFFNGGQGLHGSYQVVAGNVSHGCVRLHVHDARWIRYNFAGIGTKVIIKPY